MAGQKDAQIGSYAVRTQRRIFLCPVGMMAVDRGGILLIRGGAGEHSKQREQHLLRQSAEKTALGAWVTCWKRLEEWHLGENILEVVLTGLCH